MRIGGWIEGPADSRQRSAVSGQDVGWELGDGGNWIDLYASQDDAASWAFRSRVGETAAGDRFNGNPPALVALADGRLCCAYGNRSRRQILARFSHDRGTTWGPEWVLRDDFHSVNGWPDLGYCRLFKRPDGRLVVVYFWCTVERPQTHVEATLFSTPLTDCSGV